MRSLEEALVSLDIGVFNKIHSQTTPNDKRSLLACQSAVREIIGQYAYLEIGSYVGGSLQPHVLDERCETIISIDKRPQAAADERGFEQIYLNNTSEFMLDNLSQLSKEGTEKIVCIDADSSEIKADRIDPHPDLCFIDGEHTDSAAWRDFKFCYEVLSENGAVIFHDSMIVYNALSRIIGFLHDSGEEFKAYNLPDNVFVIEIGEFPLHRFPVISEMLVNNHIGYLSALKYSDQYRRFANRSVFRALRNLKLKFTKANVTE